MRGGAGPRPRNGARGTTRHHPREQGPPQLLSNLQSVLLHSAPTIPQVLQPTPPLLAFRSQCVASIADYARCSPRRPAVRRPRVRLLHWLLHAGRPLVRPDLPANCVCTRCMHWELHGAAAARRRRMPAAPFRARARLPRVRPHAAPVPRLGTPPCRQSYEAWSAYGCEVPMRIQVDGVWQEVRASPPRAHWRRCDSCRGCSRVIAALIVLPAVARCIAARAGLPTSPPAMDHKAPRRRSRCHPSTHVSPHLPPPSPAPSCASRPADHPGVHPLPLRHPALWCRPHTVRLPASPPLTAATACTCLKSPGRRRWLPVTLHALTLRRFPSPPLSPQADIHRQQRQRDPQQQHRHHQQLLQ